MIGSMNWKRFKNWISCSFGSHTITNDDLLRLKGASEDRLPIITNCEICNQEIAVSPHPSASWLYRIEEV